MASISGQRRSPVATPAPPPPDGGWFASQPAPPSLVRTPPGGGQTGPGTWTGPAPGTARPQGGPTGGQGGDPMDLIAQFQEGLPPSPESVAQIVAMLRAQGIPAALATHKGGTAASSDAIVLPDGRVIDVVRGWDGPNPSWTTSHVDNYALDRNVIGMNGEFVPFGEYAGGLGLTPSNTTPFTGRGGGVGGASGGGGALPGMDPSYDWRFGEGQKALERSAAARGTLMTGGMLKDLTAFGQGMASTEFGNIFDRNYRVAGLGLNAATNAGNFRSAYTDRAGNNLTGGANAAAAGTVERSNAWTNTTGRLGDLAGQWAWSRNPGWRRPGPAYAPAPDIPGSGWDW